MESLYLMSIKWVFLTIDFTWHLRLFGNLTLTGMMKFKTITLHFHEVGREIKTETNLEKCHFNLSMSYKYLKKVESKKYIM